jgi:hypothetical protein
VTIAPSGRSSSSRPISSWSISREPEPRAEGAVTRNDPPGLQPLVQCLKTPDAGPSSPGRIAATHGPHLTASYRG